ncbi:MAG: VWA domain-containing protein, partial [Zoogloeaceae bacterium]|nr:VWA domain-containing protein [Zoogloeaceae bacterium]
SGSMVGDAIMQSREAVRSIARLLGDGDRLQVLRFGSSLQPMFRRLMPCKAAVRQALGELAGTLEANLGGTEMQPALLRALRDLGPRQDGRTRAIVLVTDGAVQPSDIAGAQAELVEAGVRVFVVAVGSSAGVEVLAPLAHKTGAAIERAILGESIDAAAERMARRARHPAPATIHLSWPGADAQVLPHAPVYPGDAFELAVVAAKVPTDTVTVEVAGARHALGAVEPVENDALRALLGQARYRAAARDDRASIALAHGLLTDDTAAVLVHKRTDDTRAKTLPQTIKIPSMIPAGMAVRCVSPIAMMACPPDAAVSAADVINGGLDACIMDPVDLAAPMFSRRPATAFDLSGVPALVEAIAPTLRGLLTQARSDVPTLEDLLARLAPELASQARAYFEHLRLHLHDSATFVGVLSAIVDGLELALSDDEEIALALAMTRYNDPEQILPGAFDAD